MWEYHLCFFTKNRNNNNKTLFFGLTNNTIGNNNSFRYLLIEKKSAILTNSILKCIKFCINTSSINKQRVPLSFNSLKKIKREKWVFFLLSLHHMVLEIDEQQSFLKNSLVFHTFKIPSISDQSSCNIIFWWYPFL